MKKFWLIPWVIGISCVACFGQNQTINKGGGSGGGSGTNGVNSFNGRQGNVSLLLSDVPGGTIGNSTTGNAATATTLQGFTSNSLFFIFQLSTNNGGSLTNIQGSAVVGAVLLATTANNLATTATLATGQVTNALGGAAILTNAISGNAATATVASGLSGFSANNIAYLLWLSQTNLATTGQPGLVDKLPNDATKFLDGTGHYTVPPGSGGVATNAIANTNGIGDSTTIYRFLLMKGNLTNIDGRITGSNDVSGASWEIGTNANFRFVDENQTVMGYGTNWFIYSQTNGYGFGMTNNVFWSLTATNTAWGSAQVLTNFLTVSNAVYASSFQGTVGVTNLAGIIAATNMPGFTAGDVTSSAGSLVLTLSVVNANVGTWGDSTHVPQITVDSKGRITGVSSVAIAGGGGGTGIQTNGGSGEFNTLTNLTVLQNTNGAVPLVVVQSAGSTTNAIAIYGPPAIPGELIVNDQGSNLFGIFGLYTNSGTGILLTNFGTGQYLRWETNGGNLKISGSIYADITHVTGLLPAASVPSFLNLTVSNFTVVGTATRNFSGNSSTNGFLPVINAMDYGLSTTGDQSANIQSALNAATNLQQQVYLPAGQYLVTTQLWVGRGIRFFGDSTLNGSAGGQGSTLYTANSAIAAVYISRPGVEIDHLTFQGNGAANGGIGIKTSTNYAVPATSFKIHDCTFYNQDKAVWLEDCWDFAIRDCNVSSVNNFGYYGTNWVNDGEIKGGHNSAIVGVIIHGEGNNQAGRLEIASAFEVCSNAIQLKGSGWSGVNIHDSYFEGNTNSVVAGNGEKLTIQNNWFGTVGGGGVNNTNVILVGTDHPTIANNYFFDTGWNIDSTTFGLLDYGNRFEVTASSRNQANPITRLGMGSNIVLTAVGGGNITNNGTTGIGGALIVSGAVDLKNLGAGLGHFDSGGNLTSSLLVNADITAGTIANGSLANSAVNFGGTANQITGGGSTALGATATPFALASPLITPGLISVTGETNSATTVWTLDARGVGKQVVSVPNTTAGNPIVNSGTTTPPYETNTVPIAVKLSGSWVDSISIPMAAFYTNSDVVTPNSPASPIAITNISSGFSFGVIQSNQVHVVFSLPGGWDLSPIRVRLKALSVNTTNSVAATNIAWRVGAYCIPPLTSYTNNLTATFVECTNNVPPGLAYQLGNSCVTTDLTPAGTLAATNSLYLSIRRDSALGNGSGSAWILRECTNTVALADDVIIYFTRTNMTSMPTPTP